MADGHKQDKESMFSPLSEEVNKYIDEVPWIFLAEFFRKKLRSVGVRPTKKLVAALVKHMKAGGGDEIDLSHIRKKPFVLNITKKDMDEFSADSKEFLEKELPQLVEDALRKGSNVFVQQLKRNWAGQYATESKIDAGFRKRLGQRWRTPLMRLRMLLTIAREFGENAANRFIVSDREPKSHRMDVLIGLHARACQVSAEIITLLECGYADGAMARWRTLYELWVVARLIATHDEELAERYKDHDAVESKRELEVYKRSYEALGYEAPSVAEIDAVQRACELAVAKHGVGFEKEYGWAAKHLGISNPRFYQLEEAAGQARMRSHFKMASYNVHAGVRGLTHRLSMMQTPGLLAGASNAGLEEPGQNTAITLTQITSTLFDPEDIDTVFALQIMEAIEDEAVQGFITAADKLERDDAAFRERAST